MSEDLALEILLDFLNAVEAGIVQVKQRLKEAKVQSQKFYDISKIKWQPAEGSSGAYERSEDVNNPDFKALLKDVQEHGGKMTVGTYFVWAFKNGAVLGRKQRKR